MFRHVGFPNSGVVAHHCFIEPIELEDPENIGFAVETAFLTGLKAEI